MEQVEDENGLFEHMMHPQIQVIPKAAPRASKMQTPCAQVSQHQEQGRESNMCKGVEGITFVNFLKSAKDAKLCLKLKLKLKLFYFNTKYEYCMNESKC